MCHPNNQNCLINNDDIFSKLLQSAIDTQNNLVILMHRNTPVLFNKAFQNFTNMPTVKAFVREFGSILNRFVPHDAYFHAGKTDSENWIESLQNIPESDRIVSMINCRAEPYAFSVTIDTQVPEYTTISFCDISQDLIKRIMIENDVSIEKESGAYYKDYFVHTSKSFQNAAVFNEKSIGITMLAMDACDEDCEKYLYDFSACIKKHIRQSDMLVRWDKKVFMLAYLVENTDNAMRFSQKLLGVMKEEPFKNLSAFNMRLGTTIQAYNEEIDDIISRAEGALNRSSESAPLTLI